VYSGDIKITVERGEYMTEKIQPESTSRRKFLKGFGTGLLGTPLLLQGIGRAAQASKDDISQYLQKTEPVTLTVNGQEVRLLIEPRTTLADLLRNRLHLTGTKIVCNHGECGGCTVLLDDVSVYACQMLALDAAGKNVLTVEGLLTGEKIHPLQQAFIDEDGYQCGFCTPGQIMAAYGLLKHNPKPTTEQIRLGLSGNLCRCAAYPKIQNSVAAAAGKVSRS